MTDSKEFTVTVKDSTVKFTATDGKTANLGLTKTEIVYNTATKVGIAELDANGVELKTIECEGVANTKDNIEYKIDVTSDKGYATADGLVLNKVGDTAKVTAEKHTGVYKDGKEDGNIKFEGTITAVDSTAMAAGEKWTIASSDVEPYNWSKVTENHDLVVGEVGYLFMNVKDTKGDDIVKGDPTAKGYKIVSMNKDVLFVDEANKNELVPNKAGQAVININDKNDKTIWTYVITVKDILTKDDEVELVMKDDSLHIKYQLLEDDMVVFDLTDNEGTTITYEANDTKIRLLDDRFSMIEIEPCVVGETYCFTVYADGLRWDFSNQINDGTYYFLDWANKFVKLEKADSAVFTNCPSLFSGRGYIWAKTIPLLKKYIFLGAGPDSFQMVFPQYDYVDLAYDFAPNMLITRAHNMFLQMAVQTGVLSLICFLVFYGMYFVKSVKLYIKRKELLDDDPYLFHIGAGLFVASFGYMLSGIVNDSLPVTAPLFWAIIGIGIAVNSLIHKKHPVLIKEKETELVSEDKVTETKMVQPIANKKKKQSRKQRKQQL